MMNKGFTLLELLVAMAIFAIAGMAVMNATSSHLTGVGIIEEQTVASWVASNRLTEIQLETKWPPTNNKQGKVEMAGQEWVWIQQVQKTENKDLQSVTIRVGHTERDAKDNSVYELTTFLGNPN